MSYSPAIDRMMASVRLRLPGALDAAIINEFFIVADEFLKATLAWRELQNIAVIAGRQEYDIEPDNYGLIFQLMSCQDITSVQQASPPATTAPMVGTPVGASMPTPGTLYLNLLPSTATTLQIQIAVTVNPPLTKDNYPQIPLWICDKYAHTDWLDGVLGRMMSQPAKPYTNQAMAVYHLRRFRNAMARAKTLTLQGNTYGAQAWSFPQSFSVRHRR